MTLEERANEIVKRLRNWLSQGTGKGSGEVSAMSPTPTPTPTPSMIGENTPMVLNEPVATESAKQQIQYILNNYQPKTPDVPKGWQTPLKDYVQKMAELSYQYKLNPAMQPLLAIAETQLLRPAAAGTPNLNPYNVMPGGKMFNYNQPGMGLGYALEKYPLNITQNWTAQGWQDFRKDPTLRNLIYSHNPYDNPQGELERILAITKQLGI